MSDPLTKGMWDRGGWEGAEHEKLRRMANLTFEEKVRWLESAGKLAASIKAWRHSRGLPTITHNDEIEW